MNGNTKCKHCGADYSLHHALTDQCPEDGIEAAPGKKQRWAETVFSPVTAKDNEIMDAKCKHCGHTWRQHSPHTNQCPRQGNTFFAPVSHDTAYAESISKACDTIGFLVGEIKDAHAIAPNVAAEMLLFSWLEQIVKIRQGLNRLKAETKGR